MIRRLAILLVLVALTALGGAPRHARPALAQTPAAQPATLPNHVLPALSQVSAQSRSAQAGSQPVTITLVLNRSDEAGFEAFLQGVQDRGSPQYRHFAAQSDLTARFGPSQPAYDAVLAYLQQNGFTLLQGSTNHLTLTVQGTRAQAEQAFGVQIDDYQRGGRSFYANDRDPSLPASIASLVQAVIGLSNLAQPRPAVAEPETPEPNVAPAMTPMALAQAYKFGGLGSGINGTGQKVGLVEFDNYLDSDVQSWLVAAGLCTQAQISASTCASFNNLSRFPVNGGTSVGPNAIEDLLDIDTVLGMAQGAQVVVYDSPDCYCFETMFNTMIDDGDTVISNSWVYCEDNTDEGDAASIDSILQSAAASGISVFTASDDTGSSCTDGTVGGAPSTIDVPADAPNGTAVGGTTLSVTASGGYQSESWWNGTCSSGPCAGGYGVSMFTVASTPATHGCCLAPSYQSGFTGSSTRSVPDVSADADPHTGVQIYEASRGGMIRVGGTSMSAPEWAAGLALVNQQMGHLTGNLNAALYGLAVTSGFHPFMQMTAPDNDFAHLGLGTFSLANLVLAFSGKAVTSAASTVVANPDYAPASGSAGSTITATLLDGNGDPVPNLAVALGESSGGNSTITTTSGSTNPAGQATFTVSDATPETVTFTATDATDGLQLTKTAQVTFTSSGLKLGDVNGDGQVTALDVLCVLRLVVGLPGSSGCPNPPPGDPIVVNGEAAPSSLDALCIQRGVAGYPATDVCPSILAP